MILLESSPRSSFSERVDWQFQSQRVITFNLADMARENKPRIVICWRNLSEGFRWKQYAELIQNNCQHFHSEVFPTCQFLGQEFRSRTFFMYIAVILNCLVTLTRLRWASFPKVVDVVRTEGGGGFKSFTFFASVYHPRFVINVKIIIILEN